MLTTFQLLSNSEANSLVSLTKLKMNETLFESILREISESLSNDYKYPLRIHIVLGKAATEIRMSWNLTSVMGARSRIPRYIWVSTCQEKPDTHLA
jgi:hypothetical protein